MKKLLLLVITFVSLQFALQAQITEVQAAIDTNNLLIGDQLHFSITAKSSLGTNIIFPAIKDSIGKIEFLQTYKTDTISKKGSIVLRKKYLITCFDSGTHFIPNLPVLGAYPKSNTIDTNYTNIVAINFNTVKVDTTKPFKDIKPVMEEPFDIWEYLPYFLILLVLVALVYFGYRFWKKYKKREQPVLDYDPSIPPHIIAKEALLQLENEKLWQKGQLKQYHSRLSDILRTYIERRFDFSAMEMTTAEIISELKNNTLVSELIFDLKKTLELADLVKFAKYHPLPDENATSMNLAYQFVDTTALSAPDNTNQEEASDVQ